MTDLVNTDDHIEEVLTAEEELKINEIKLAHKDLIADEPEPEVVVPKFKAVQNDSFFGAFSFIAALPSLSTIFADVKQSMPEAKDKSIARQLGFKRKIVVTNISGKKAWIVLSPAPISGVSSFGITKVGQIDFSNVGGQIKCQQSPLLDSSSRKFDLDNNQIYYTVFFECDGKWKVHFKDRKVNAKNHDINLLERHVLEAVDFDFAPLN